MAGVPGARKRQREPDTPGEHARPDAGVAKRQRGDGKRSALGKRGIQVGRGRLPAGSQRLGTRSRSGNTTLRLSTRHTLHGLAALRAAFPGQCQAAFSSMTKQVVQVHARAAGGQLQACSASLCPYRVGDGTQYALTLTSVRQIKALLQLQPGDTVRLRVLPDGRVVAEAAPPAADLATQPCRVELTEAHLRRGLVSLRDGVVSRLLGPALAARVFKGAAGFPVIADSPRQPGGGQPAGEGGQRSSLPMEVVGSLRSGPRPPQRPHWYIYIGSWLRTAGAAAGDWLVLEAEGGAAAAGGPGGSAPAGGGGGSGPRPVIKASLQRGQGEAEPRGREAARGSSAVPGRRQAVSDRDVAPGQGAAATGGGPGGLQGRRGSADDSSGGSDPGDGSITSGSDSSEEGSSSGDTMESSGGESGSSSGGSSGGERWSSGGTIRSSDNGGSSGIKRMLQLQPGDRELPDGRVVAASEADRPAQPCRVELTESGLRCGQVSVRYGLVEQMLGPALAARVVKGAAGFPVVADPPRQQPGCGQAAGEGGQRPTTEAPTVGSMKSGQWSLWRQPNWYICRLGPWFRSMGAAPGDWLVLEAVGGAAAAAAAAGGPGGSPPAGGGGGSSGLRLTIKAILQRGQGEPEQRGCEAAQGPSGFPGRRQAGSDRDIASGEGAAATGGRPGGLQGRRGLGGDSSGGRDSGDGSNTSGSDSSEEGSSSGDTSTSSSGEIWSSDGSISGSDDGGSSGGSGDPAGGRPGEPDVPRERACRFAEGGERGGADCPGGALGATLAKRGRLRTVGTRLGPNSHSPATTLQLGKKGALTGLAALRAAFPEQCQAAFSSMTGQVVQVHARAAGGQLQACSALLYPWRNRRDQRFLHLSRIGQIKALLQLRPGDTVRLRVLPDGRVVAEAAARAADLPAQPCRVELTEAHLRHGVVSLRGGVVSHLLGPALATRVFKGAAGFPVIAGPPRQPSGGQGEAGEGGQQFTTETPAVGLLKSGKQSQSELPLWRIHRLGPWLRSMGAAPGDWLVLEAEGGAAAAAAAAGGPGGSLPAGGGGGSSGLRLTIKASLQRGQGEPEQRGRETAQGGSAVPGRRQASSRGGITAGRGAAAPAGLPGALQCLGPGAGGSDSTSGEKSSGAGTGKSSSSCSDSSSSRGASSSSGSGGTDSGGSDSSGRSDGGTSGDSTGASSGSSDEGSSGGDGLAPLSPPPSQIPAKRAPSPPLQSPPLPRPAQPLPPPPQWLLGRIRRGRAPAHDHDHEERVRSAVTGPGDGGGPLSGEADDTGADCAPAPPPVHHAAAPLSTSPTSEQPGAGAPEGPGPTLRRDSSGSGPGSLPRQPPQQQQLRQQRQPSPKRPKRRCSPVPAPGGAAAPGSGSGSGPNARAQAAPGRTGAGGRAAGWRAAEPSAPAGGGDGGGCRGAGGSDLPAGAEAAVAAAAPPVAAAPQPPPLAAGPPGGVRGPRPQAAAPSDVCGAVGRMLEVMRQLRLGKEEARGTRRALRRLKASDRDAYLHVAYLTLCVAVGEGDEEEAREVFADIRHEAERVTAAAPAGAQQQQQQQQQQPVGPAAAGGGVGAGGEDGVQRGCGANGAGLGREERSGEPRAKRHHGCRPGSACGVKIEDGDA